MASQHRARPQLHPSEYGSENRDSQVSLSGFPLPPNVSHLATPPNTPFQVRFGQSDAADRPGGNFGKRDHSIQDNTCTSISNFMPTSFSGGNSSFNGRPGSDSDSDFTAVPDSRRASLALIDSPPPTPSTDSVVTTFNSLDLYSPMVGKERLHTVHQEHSPSPSPYLSHSEVPFSHPSWPYQHCRRRHHTLGLDIDATVPSSAVHSGVSDVMNNNTASAVARGKVAATITPTTNYPPSPILPPPPPVPRIIGRSTTVRMLGAGSTDASVTLPSQATAVMARKGEEENSIVYEDVASTVLPHEQDTWMQGEVKEELSLPPPKIMPQCSRPPVPDKSPKRTSSTRGKMVAAETLTGKASLLCQIECGVNERANIGNVYMGRSSRIPKPIERRSAPRKVNVNPLVSTIGNLPRTEEKEQSGGTGIGDALPTLNPTKATPPSRLEGIDATSTSDPEVHNGSIQTTDDVILALASNLIANRIIFDFTSLDRSEANVESLNHASKDLISALRQRADDLAQQKERFQPIIVLMQRALFISAAVGEESHEARLNRLLRVANLREALSRSKEVEIYWLLTECVIQLLETRMKDVSEEKHKNALCLGYQATVDFGRKKSIEREMKNVRGEMMVSEKSSEDTLGQNIGEEDTQKRKREKDETIDKAVYAPWRQPKKSLAKNNETTGLESRLDGLHDRAEKTRDRVPNSRIRKTPANSAVLVASPPPNEVNILEKDKGVPDPNADTKDDDASISEESDWVSPKIHGSIGHITAKRDQKANSQIGWNQSRKVAENAQVRRHDPHMYHFLREQPTRSVSPQPLLVDHRPNQPIPSLRKGRPSPPRLTLSRSAHDAVGLDMNVPKVTDEKGSPKAVRFKNLIPKQMRGGSRANDTDGDTKNAGPVGGSSSAGAAVLRRENEVAFGSSMGKIQELQERNGAVDPENGNEGQKGDGGRFNIKKILPK